MFSRKVIKQYQYRVEIGFPFSEYDIKWDYCTVIYYAIVGYITGILSGAFGFGGGTILGPFLLHINMHPIITKLTCNFIILFSASALTLQFIFSGMLTSNYMIVLVMIATISSIFASLLIAAVVKKYGRYSIVVICLGLVFAVSSIIVIMKMNEKIKYDDSHGINSWKFNSPC